MANWLTDILEKFGPASGDATGEASLAEQGQNSSNIPRVPAQQPAANVQTVAPAQSTVATNEAPTQEQTAAALLSPFAQPRFANYAPPQVQLPEEDPEIKKQRLEHQRAIMERLNGLDSEYKKNLEEAKDREFKANIFASIGNYLPQAIAGATAMNTKAAVQAPKLPQIQVGDLSAPVNSKYKTDYEKLIQQYKAVKDGGLTDKDKLYAAIANMQSQSKTLGQNLNVQNTDRNAGIRVNNAILNDQKDNELSDKETDEIGTMSNTLSEIRNLHTRAKDFKDMLGPVAAKKEELKSGMLGAPLRAISPINKEYEKFRSDTKAMQAEYRKLITGLTASEPERKELMGMIPDPTSPYDRYIAQAQAFEERVQRYMNNKLGAMEKYQGKNVGGYKEPKPQGDVSLGKTEVPVPAGHQEIETRGDKQYKWNPSTGTYQRIK
jgi:hypothetical protein